MHKLVGHFWCHNNWLDTVLYKLVGHFWFFIPHISLGFCFDCLNVIQVSCFRPLVPCNHSSYFQFWFWGGYFNWHFIPCTYHRLLRNDLFHFSHFLLCCNIYFGFFIRFDWRLLYFGFGFLSGWLKVILLGYNWLSILTPISIVCTRLHLQGHCLCHFFLLLYRLGSLLLNWGFFHRCIFFLLWRRLRGLNLLDWSELFLRGLHCLPRWFDNFGGCRLLLRLFGYFGHWLGNRLRLLSYLWFVRWNLLNWSDRGFDYFRLFLLIKNFISDWIHHLYSIKRRFHFRSFIFISRRLIRLHLLLRLLRHYRLNLHTVDAEVEVAVVTSPH